MGGKQTADLVNWVPCVAKKIKIFFKTRDWVPIEGMIMLIKFKQHQSKIFFQLAVFILKIITNYYNTPT